MIEYHGEGGNGNDRACRGVIDDNLAECSANWGCKCQDSRNNTYACLRTLNESENSLFCMFEDQNDTTEMYNLQTDPYQMHNLLDPGSSWHVNRLRELTSCKGFQGCNNDVVVKVVPKNSEDQELRLPRFDLDYWIEAIGGAFYNFTYKHF